MKLKLQCEEGSFKEKERARANLKSKKGQGFILRARKGEGSF
jgi:hypothetical protein